MGKSDPRARDRIIGAKLRAIRVERAEISLERAAEIAGWSPSRLSRTERGLRHITTDEVPGLLQTYETAMGVMRADGIPEADLETRWMARLRRQQILGKVDYTAYISEVVLRTAFGGSEAQRGQLEHLLRAQERAIRVRIIPAYQTRVLVLHSWMWMGFPNTTPVVHVELSPGSFYLHDRDVAPYSAALKRLDGAALSQGDSRKLMGDLVKGL